MKVLLDKAVIVSAVQAKKNPEVHYLEIRSGDGDSINCSTKLLTPDQAKSLLLTPLRMEGTFRLSQYEGKQLIEWSSGVASPLVPAK